MMSLYLREKKMGVCSVILDYLVNITSFFFFFSTMPPLNFASIFLKVESISLCSIIISSKGSFQMPPENHLMEMTNCRILEEESSLWDFEQWLDFVALNMIYRDNNLPTA